MKNFLTIPLYEEIETGQNSELYVYLPQIKDKSVKAVIICGGGGFNKVNTDHEGHQFAQWLNTIGVAGIVLNYRLPNGNKEIPEKDLRQAVKIVRSNAKAWNINEEAIGAAGFSIGGHAISLLAVKEEKESKLDFTMFFYTVISMSDKLTHKPSRERLLGTAFDNKEIEQYSSENFVSPSTPQALLMACDDDGVVNPLNSILYYNKLKENNIPASLYIFASGGHGWGMNSDFIYHDEFLSLVQKWLIDLYTT